MKLLALLVAMVFGILFSQYVLANPHKEILYHCPSIQDLKYRKGTFTAMTQYCNLPMRWFTNQMFPEKTVKIISFNSTNKSDTCIGGACIINCIYNTSASSKILFLQVSHQKYRIIKTAQGPWKNNICSAKQPETCTFYIVPNTFKWYLSYKSQGIGVGKITTPNF